MIDEIRPLLEFLAAYIAAMLAIGIIEVGVLSALRRRFPGLSCLRGVSLRFQDAGQERNGIVANTACYVDFIKGRFFLVLAALVELFDGLVLEIFFILGIFVDLVLVLFCFTVFLQYTLGLGGILSELERNRQLGGTITAKALRQAI